MKIETKHYLNSDYPRGIERTIKTWKLFGILVKKKIYYYPKLEMYDIITNW